MSFTLFSNRKNQINNAIAGIQSQIAQLQQQLADQQAFLQEIGTVEQAGESALTQTQTFLTMIRAIDPSQEEVFWQAMDALRNEELTAIAPSNDDTPEEAEQEAAAETDISTIDVDVISKATEEELHEDTSETETLETQEEEDADKPVLNGNGNGHLSVERLNNLTIQQIRKLASAKGVEGRGKRWEIAQRLDGLVVQDDVDALN